jgi:hypothetical protein
LALAVAKGVALADARTIALILSKVFTRPMPTSFGVVPIVQKVQTVQNVFVQ